MSRSQLFSMLGVYGYRVTKSEVEEQTLYTYIEPLPHRICCSSCKSKDVIRRGKQERWYRSPPIGSKSTFLIADIPRVQCRKCGLVRQIHIGLATPRKKCTHAFARYVIQLCRLMTIQDVARMLDISWDTVKEIEMNYLKRNYSNPPLKECQEDLDRRNMYWTPTRWNACLNQKLNFKFELDVS